MHYNQARAPRRRAELVSATACVPLVLAAALAMLPIAAAGQQIYKCKGSAGEVLYQNVPCAGPSKGSLKSEAPIITYQPQPQQFYDVDAQLKLEAIRRELARYQMEDAARLQATREAEADYLRRMHQREREMRQQPESRRLEGTPDGWQRMTATERAAYDQRKAAEAQAATAAANAAAQSAPPLPHPPPLAQRPYTGPVFNLQTGKTCIQSGVVQTCF